MEVILFCQGLLFAVTKGSPTAVPALFQTVIECGGSQNQPAFYVADLGWNSYKDDIDQMLKDVAEAKIAEGCIVGNFQLFAAKSQAPAVPLGNLVPNIRIKVPYPTLAKVPRDGWKLFFWASTAEKMPKKWVPLYDDTKNINPNLASYYHIGIKGVEESKVGDSRVLTITVTEWPAYDLVIGWDG